MDRETLKLMASGNYIKINNTYDQQQHQNYVDGATWAFDQMKKHLKDEKPTRTENETQTQNFGKVQ